MRNRSPQAIPPRTVERLVVYRRLLARLKAGGDDYVHSHVIAERANNSAAQVRRDLMQIGYTGTPARGYSVDDLLKRIDNVFRKKTDQKVVLAGAGNLGRAIVSYFRDRGPRLDIVAAFDNNPEKVGASISGCPCYHVDQLPRVVRQRKVTLGIVTVPAGAAQAIADRMLLSGIRGILNFAPVRLRVPSDAYCDDMDIIGKLEKIAFFTD